MRTHFCGLVSEALVGQSVTLCGWADVARNLGGVCFIDLRDHEGIVQVVADPDRPEVFAVAADVGYEYCLRVTGTVRARQSVNERIATGKVEVIAEKIEILNRADKLPFYSHETPGEDVRLKYRYLDLRNPDMQRKMRKRIALVQALRRRLDAAGFQDIETPILTKATPEGARDYLVPSRVHRGRVLRVAAVAAAVQAAADDGRHGSLLPDRALLPRRGPARRSPARIHPARHGVRLRHRARHPGPRRSADPRCVRAKCRASNWPTRSRA